MSEKIKLVLGENVHINRNVLVYDGKEKKPTFHVYHYRKSLWLPDNTVSAFLEEENEYSQINGDYILEGEVRATEPGKYTAVLRGVHRYECEIPLEWEIFSPDDPRITENPYADYFLGKKNKYELYSFGLNPLNMDEASRCDLPTYEQVVRYYQEKHTPKIPLKVNCSIFSMKSGFHEYQDSYYPKEAFSRELKKDDTLRFAISDGVTNSYRAKPYADLVTKQFFLSGAEFLRTKILPEIGERWKDFLLRDAKETYPNNPLMLRKEMKLLQHKRASATLAGLEIDKNTKNARITTVGDSVILQLDCSEQELRIVDLTPAMSWKDFTNRPDQIHSDDMSCPDEYIKTKTRAFNRGSVFILATDALAQFILTPEEEQLSEDKLTDLLTIQDNDAFEEYCSKRKAEGRIQDDDYTLMIVRIE